MKPKTIQLISLIAAVLIFSTGCNPANRSDDEVIGMANPASVYCEENGGSLEIRTQKDGGQYGVCIFEDGSECDEWAFYQDQCKPGDVFPLGEESAETSVEVEPVSSQVTALYGAVITASSKGPSESLLAPSSGEFPQIFLAGENEAIEAMIQEIKDQNEPANKANFWGQLDCNSADQCLLTVTRMRLDGPGDEVPGDLVEGWEGVIYSGPAGPRSGGDDYFALLGEFPFQYGIWSLDDSLNQQLEELRDSGQAVRIWGELHAGRMDWNATQIVVTQIELIDADPSQIPSAPSW